MIILLICSILARHSAILYNYKKICHILVLFVKFSVILTTKYTCSITTGVIKIISEKLILFRSSFARVANDNGAESWGMGGASTQDLCVSKCAVPSRARAFCKLLCRNGIADSVPTSIAQWVPAGEQKFKWAPRNETNKTEKSDATANFFEVIKHFCAVWNSFITGGWRRARKRLESHEIQINQTSKIIRAYKTHEQSVQMIRSYFQEDTFSVYNHVLSNVLQNCKSIMAIYILLRN